MQMLRYVNGAAVELVLRILVYNPMECLCSQELLLQPWFSDIFSARRSGKELCVSVKVHSRHDSTSQDLEEVQAGDTSVTDEDGGVDPDDP